MRTEVKKSRSGSAPAALLLGIIFGILLVMTQELLYQYRLMSRYELYSAGAGAVVVDPVVSTGAVSSTGTSAPAASDTAAVTEFAGNSNTEDAGGGESIVSADTAVIPETGRGDEIEGEESVQTGPKSIYSYDGETGSTTIEMDSLKITLNL